MLISEKHGFIFIHIYKNAGSSITRALMPYCSNPVHIFAHYILKGVGIFDLNPIPYSKHIKAAELVREMGYEPYRSHFSFCVVRNPWDWHVSFYRYVLKDKEHYQHESVKRMRDFDEFIRHKCRGIPEYQKDFIYSESGEKLVDYIARFENIEKEFKAICHKIGIKPKKLPHLNSSKNKHYRDYYTKETRKLVGDFFKPDIELFGYDF